MLQWDTSIPHTVTQVTVHIWPGTRALLSLITVLLIRLVVEGMLCAKQNQKAPPKFFYWNTVYAALCFNPVLAGLVISVIFNLSPCRTPHKFSPIDLLLVWKGPYFKSNWLFILGNQSHTSVTAHPSYWSHCLPVQTRSAHHVDGVSSSMVSEVGSFQWPCMKN